MLEMPSPPKIYCLLHDLEDAVLITETSTSCCWAVKTSVRMEGLIIESKVCISRTKGKQFV